MRQLADLVEVPASLNSLFHSGGLGVPQMMPLAQSLRVRKFSNPAALENTEQLLLQYSTPGFLVV